ncbi:group III truncated hemoglobin [Sulfurimonas sp.]|nr:group III truncated hemoglobin [Sulfurimonas sp.]
MLEKEYTKQNLRRLVIQFYTKVLDDELISPVFIGKLGADLAGATWGPHLDTITEFWASFTTGGSTYNGSPFAPHTQLGKLSREMFERWLKLFHETLDETYEPHLTKVLKDRSELIAGNFMRNLRL